MEIRMFRALKWSNKRHTPFLEATVAFSNCVACVNPAWPVRVVRAAAQPGHELPAAASTAPVPGAPLAQVRLGAPSSHGLQSLLPTSKAEELANPAGVVRKECTELRRSFYNCTVFRYPSSGWLFPACAGIGTPDATDTTFAVLQPSFQTPLASLFWSRFRYTGIARFDIQECGNMQR